jgi:hypothetical protein
VLCIRAASDLDYGDLMAFVTSHFDECCDWELSCVSHDVPHGIVSHSALQLRTEDSLSCFVSRLATPDTQCIDFVEFVPFEFLSNAFIFDFLAMMNDSLELFTPHIWMKVRSRLTALPPACSQNRREVKIGVRFEPTSRLCGMIACLTDPSCANVHVQSQGVVIVMAST